MNKRYNLKKLEKHFRNQDIDRLIKYLNKGNYQVRRQAAIYLGNLKDLKSLAALESHIEDPVAIVREAVAEAIMKMDTSSEMKNRISEVEKRIEQLKERKRESGKGRHSDPISFRDKLEWTETLKNMLKRPMGR